MSNNNNKAHIISDIRVKSPNLPKIDWGDLTEYLKIGCVNSDAFDAISVSSGSETDILNTNYEEFEHTTIPTIKYKKTNWPVSGPPTKRMIKYPLSKLPEPAKLSNSSIDEPSTSEKSTPGPSKPATPKPPSFGPPTTSTTSEPAVLVSYENYIKEHIKYFELIKGSVRDSNNYSEQVDNINIDIVLKNNEIKKINNEIDNLIKKRDSLITKKKFSVDKINRFKSIIIKKNKEFNLEL